MNILKNSDKCVFYNLHDLSYLIGVYITIFFSFIFMTSFHILGMWSILVLAYERNDSLMLGIFTALTINIAYYFLLTTILEGTICVT